MSTGQIEGEQHYYCTVVSMSFLCLLSWGIHYSQPADLLHPAWSSTYIFQWAIVLKYFLPSVCQFSLIYLFFFLASSSFIITDSLYWTRLFNWLGRIFWDPFFNTVMKAVRLSSSFFIFIIYLILENILTWRLSFISQAVPTRNVPKRTCCHLATGVPCSTCFLEMSAMDPKL